MADRFHRYCMYSAPSVRWLAIRFLVGVGIITAATAAGEDPWPEYQRTASRLGRTCTIGPQTPRIAWNLQIATSPSSIAASTVLDAEGRLFSGIGMKLTCVDTKTREIVWEFPTLDNVVTAATIWQGRVLFGTSADNFYCLNAATGEMIWSADALPHPNRGQAVDDTLPGGVVYYPSESGALYARRVEDGSEVWTVTTSDILTSPSLHGLERLFIGGGLSAARAHATEDGQMLWPGPGGSNNGVAVPVENGRAYAANFNSPGPLYCLDAITGDVIWSYEGVGSNNSAIALGHDGTVYIAEVWGVADLIAISPEGEELWRYDVDEQVKYPPIVAGDGTIYLCSFVNPDNGHVHAVRPDGTGLWVKEMPDYVQASPMLAPDGTLYVVCRDKYLYAFKDPDVLGDLDGNGSVGAADLLILLASWGPCPDLPETCPADLDLDGNVGAADLLILLSNWG